jgi:hypothetical protein
LIDKQGQTAARIQLPGEVVQLAGGKRLVAALSDGSVVALERP